MWKDTLKKRKIVWVFMLPILKKLPIHNKISSGGVAAADAINTEDTILSREFKKQKTQELKQNWSEKKMHGQFVREILEKADKDKIWQ